MANPVTVEATRGNRIESAHRGAGAVVDADGRVVLAFGDAERPVYPRSAVKALQALPLVESGAADRLSLSDNEIALACASHSGSEAHVAAVRAMLAKAGYDEGALECGAHWPLGEEEGRALARSGQNADRPAQQLLGQTCGLHLCRLRDGRGSQGLCRAGSCRAARGDGGDLSDDRRPLERGDARRRRLLDPDLRRASARACPRLRAPRNGAGAAARARAKLRRAFAQPSRRIP